MGKSISISDAAREVNVESHVLRYWEEELKLPIKRNEMGHRYYTQEDIERLKQIKLMKERGLQLKAIRMILKDGKLDVLQTEEKEPQSTMAIEIVDSHEQPRISDVGVGNGVEKIPQIQTTQDKAKRLQWMLQELIRQTLKENNSELCRDLRDSVVKELDYQFRMQEEREDERDKKKSARDEAYYQKMDELLRKKSKGKLFSGKMGKKRSAF